MTGAGREDSYHVGERERRRVFNLGAGKASPEEVAFERRSEDRNPPQILGDVRALLGQTS